MLISVKFRCHLLSLRCLSVRKTFTIWPNTVQFLARDRRKKEKWISTDWRGRQQKPCGRVRNQDRTMTEQRIHDGNGSERLLVESVDQVLKCSKPFRQKDLRGRRPVDTEGNKKDLYREKKEKKRKRKYLKRRGQKNYFFC